MADVFNLLNNNVQKLVYNIMGNSPKNEKYAIISGNTNDVYVFHITNENCSQKNLDLNLDNYCVHCYFKNNLFEIGDLIYANRVINILSDINLNPIKGFYLFKKRDKSDNNKLLTHKIIYLIEEGEELEKQLNNTSQVKDTNNFEKDYQFIIIKTNLNIKEIIKAEVPSINLIINEDARVSDIK